MAPPERPASHAKLVAAAAWVGVLTLAAGIWARDAGTLRARHPLPENVRSPILALELIRSPELVDKIARPDPPSQGGAPAPPPRHEPEQLAYSVYVDYLFITAYAAFFVLAGWLIVSTFPLPAGLLGGLVIVLALAGAVFDVRENIAMLDVLAHRAADPRSPSLIKWALIFAATLCSTPLFLDRTARPLRRAIGVLGIACAMVAGIGGLAGVWTGTDRLIETAAGRLAVTFLLAVVFLGTRGVLRDGLLPALDRLAARRPFKWLAAWPPGDQNETVGESVLDG